MLEIDPPRWLVWLVMAGGLAWAAMLCAMFLKT